MPRAEPAIESRGLTKSYGRSRGIVDLDLSVGQGEVVGLIGANGAGKTTFMRTLLDFVRPTTGSVSAFGLDSVRDSVALRRRTTYLPGELSLPPRLTGHQVLDRFAFTRSREDLAQAPVVAERLGLDLSRRIGDLSKGNKQKVALVLAFAPRADLVVLDEPTSGLDPLLQREFATMVRERTDQGTTVLLSSHVMSEVEHLTSRVALLRAGRLVAYEDIAAIRERASRRGTARLTDRAEAGRLAAGLGRLPRVSRVSADGELVSFVVQGDMDAVVKALAGVAVTSLDVDRAELEDAFFAAYDDGSSADPR